ncbi:uncharacterized protein LOC130789420 [Actinidia eriantha]|uniref:uncharacterized protein LOC130789420 n=1 Tax=Actinidia eriantha TaxID=165200 RepID=UPI00259095F5|nr:uncharacterized protein LOC130789420 [Actinidia eriantha]
MSASRGYGASCEDKKGKKMSFNDDKYEEIEDIRAEKEAGDGLDYASMEGNALSSDLTESNTDTAVHSKSGDQSSSLTKVNKFKNRTILFEIQLTPTDVEKGRFSIPVEIALGVFPPQMAEASLHRPYYKKIKISIPTPYYTWFMAITYDPEERLFLIKSREWQHFADWHGFKPGDIICFSKPFPRAKSTHFLIEHFNKADEEETSSTVVVPEFEEENFLFQKRLMLHEVRNLSQRLLPLPKKKVKKHFSALRIPAPSHKMERLYFTDARNKEWCWKFMFDSGEYVVVDGWEGFVDEHKVDAGDKIRFYKFAESRKLHPERHFLIQHVKKATVQVSTNPNAGQSGTIEGMREIRAARVQVEELRSIGGVIGEAAIDEGAVGEAATNEDVVGVEEGVGTILVLEIAPWHESGRFYWKD